MAVYRVYREMSPKIYFIFDEILFDVISFTSFPDLKNELLFPSTGEMSGIQRLIKNASVSI